MPLYKPATTACTAALRFSSRADTVPTLQHVCLKDTAQTLLRTDTFYLLSCGYGLSELSSCEFRKMKNRTDILRSVDFKPWPSHVPPHVAAPGSIKYERLTTTPARKRLACVRAQNPSGLVLVLCELSAVGKRDREQR